MNSSENEQVEDKGSLGEIKAIVESIAAFATAAGGTVHVGIRPDGARVGVPLGRNTLENLANEIKMNTEPPQYPSLLTEGGQDSAVIRIRIEESPIKPVWAYGRPFKRVGRTNQRLSPEETRRLMELTLGRSWDAMLCAELRMEHLDRRTVADFLRRAGQKAGAATEVVLQNLGLMTSEGLCNGAALLFAETPERFIAGVSVKCARFAGLTAVEFIDEQTIAGNVLAQVDRAVAFVIRNTRQGIRFTGLPEREIVSEYPMDAVREAIINAVCHRDYTAAGTVQVRIFDDRLEVWNPGVLPADLSLEDLYREHKSHPRNRRLAEAFYRVRLIEQWGTGTLRIVRECEARGMPRPEFTVAMGDFIVRFRKSAQSVAEVELHLPKDRQRKALDYVRQHGSITRNLYRTLVGLGASQAAEDLADLVQAGILARRGRGRATAYVLASSEARVRPDD